MDALIIEAAVNGVTTKRRNPNVPRSVDEIVESGLACIEAGAAIVHNHNDDGVISFNPRHATEPYVAAWRAIYERHPDALLYPTMGGGGPHTNVEERYAHMVDLGESGMTRLGLIDPGTLNLGGLDDDGVPSATEIIYQNTFRDVRYMVSCCEKYGLAPSVSIFEPGFLRLALAYHAAGRLPKGALIKLYFGAGTPGFGLPPTVPSLEAYLALLEGTGLPWSVAALGGDIVTSGLAAEAIKRGGHVRVGLEDYSGPRQPRNEELVAEVVGLSEAAGRPVASFTEAATILGVRPGRYSAAAGRIVRPQD
jgi:uncharacterized protein (DUF849 family)